MKTKKILVSLAATAALISACDNNKPDDGIEFKTNTDKFFYINGFNMGKEAKQQDMDINPEAIYAGIKDAVNGKESKIKAEDFPAIVQTFIEESKTKQIAMAEQNKKAGEQFLAENATKEGVKKTNSGLQYQVLTANPTGAKPGAKDKVKVHYHGTLIDGTVFDSSVERGEPVVFAANEVIPGWAEGLQLMKVGEKFKFFIPSNLAYKDHQAGPVIKPYSTLIFEVELISIEKSSGKK